MHSAEQQFVPWKYVRPYGLSILEFLVLFCIGKGLENLSLPYCNETKSCDNSSVILVSIGFRLALYLQLPLISAIIISAQHFRK